ncbi:MAG: hypothetical protein H2041_06525 [Phenylobacterium sp.]|uniref:ComEA family DNA-binding protein n=1 Tax=Phenylobacterium sp. TaxID=1871053 RepID=UPI00181B5D8D|nr:hypothetical protein [Phenylobacterium sp.]MBA4793304.1 hypothetical protein [Phenylobacterium sp.]
MSNPNDRQEANMAQGQTVYLNTSTEEDLRTVAGDARARALVEARPFLSWDDVERVDGVDAEAVNAMKSAGAQLGEAPEGPIGEPGSGGQGGATSRNFGRA